MGRGGAAKATAGLVNRQRFLTSSPLLFLVTRGKKDSSFLVASLELAVHSRGYSSRGSSRFLPVGDSLYQRISLIWFLLKRGSTFFLPNLIWIFLDFLQLGKFLTDFKVFFLGCCFGSRSLGTVVLICSNSWLLPVQNLSLCRVFVGFIPATFVISGPFGSLRTLSNWGSLRFCENLFFFFPSLR